MSPFLFYYMANYSEPAAIQTIEHVANELTKKIGIVDTRIGDAFYDNITAATYFDEILSLNNYSSGLFGYFYSIKTDYIGKAAYSDTSISVTNPHSLNDYLADINKKLSSKGGPLTDSSTGLFKALNYTFNLIGHSDKLDEKIWGKKATGIIEDVITNPTAYYDVNKASSGILSLIETSFYNDKNLALRLDALENSMTNVAVITNEIIKLTSNKAAASLNSPNSTTIDGLVSVVQKILTDDTANAAMLTRLSTIETDLDNIFEMLLGTDANGVHTFKTKYITQLGRLVDTDNRITSLESRTAKYLLGKNVKDMPSADFTDNGAIADTLQAAKDYTDERNTEVKVFLVGDDDFGDETNVIGSLKDTDTTIKTFLVGADAELEDEAVITTLHNYLVGEEDTLEETNVIGALKEADDTVKNYLLGEGGVYGEATEVIPTIQQDANKTRLDLDILWDYIYDTEKTEENGDVVTEKGAITLLKDEISTLKNEKTELQDRCNALETTVDNLTTLITSLTSLLNSLHPEYTFSVDEETHTFLAVAVPDEEETPPSSGEENNQTNPPSSNEDTDEEKPSENEDSTEEPEAENTDGTN